VFYNSFSFCCNLAAFTQQVQKILLKFVFILAFKGAYRFFRRSEDFTPGALSHPNPPPRRGEGRVRVMPPIFLCNVQVHSVTTFPQTSLPHSVPPKTGHTPWDSGRIPPGPSLGADGKSPEITHSMWVGVGPCEVSDINWKSSICDL
jgi:hypothetical protein